mmetsp:Transcript_27021/g.93788  ORF Transcript_27021/g.93788 Transcript_27021/m.93788 type:complete len:394 (+) Transcript_27021:348-1529(+)
MAIRALTVNGKGRKGSGTSEKRHDMLRRMLSSHVAAGGSLVALQEWPASASDDLASAGLRHLSGAGNDEASVAFDPTRVHVRVFEGEAPDVVRDRGGSVEEVAGAAMLRVRGFAVAVQPIDAAAAPFLFVSFHGIARWRAEWEVIYSGGMPLPDIPKGKHGVWTRRAFLRTVASISARKRVLVVCGGDWNVLSKEDASSTEALMRAECAEAATAARVAWCVPRYKMERDGLRSGTLDFFVLFAPTDVMRSLLGGGLRASTPMSPEMAASRGEGVSACVPHFVAGVVADDPGGDVLDHDPVLLQFVPTRYEGARGGAGGGDSGRRTGDTGGAGALRPPRSTPVATPAAAVSSPPPPPPPTATETPGGSPRCAVCSRRFKNERGLAIHIGRMHPS